MRNEEKEVQAVMSLTNTMAIGIHYEDGSDNIWCKWLGDEKSRWTETPIESDEDGRMYFQRSGVNYYIDEFMKI